MPTKKKLESQGAIELLPSTKTVYIVEAINELTIDRKEIEIDVLPLPSISNIRLVTPPKVNIPTIYESKLKYPASEKQGRKFLQQTINYFINKFIIKEPKSLKTIFISFNQHSECIQVLSLIHI